jgi:hypothetical protein
MRRSGAIVLAVGALLACRTVDVDIARIPLCGSVESLPPLVAEGECEEGVLAGYLTQLREQAVAPGSQALVRVELDESSRVRSACVDEGVGVHAWHARLHLARNLDALESLPPGPECVARKRIDLNRYQSKLAEIEEAERWCDYEVGDRMAALEHCQKFPSDWILYHRTGYDWPYLYLKRDGSKSTDPASFTASECGRKNLNFEEVSACILADGFQLLPSPEYELLAQPLEEADAP